MRRAAKPAYRTIDLAALLVRRRRWFLKGMLWLGAAGICTSCLILASVFLYLDPQIPSTDTYRHYRLKTPLRIYTADGALISEFGDRLVPIALEDVPQGFLDGLISTEDKRFYSHGGIDFVSLANDVLGLLTSEVRTGASTLTMQLAKVVSFSHRQEFIRKFKEMLLALKVERELGKDEILELYVNIMAFGKRAYGVQAAAQTYYGKPVAELNLAQMAMLAGIIKKPEGGNPINGPGWALDRRNLVLRRMLAQGAIGDDEYREAVAAPITAQVFSPGIDLPSPYPAEWVRGQLFERFGEDIYSGVVVHTTLDSRLQSAAQKALQGGLIAYDRRHGYRGPEKTVSKVAQAGSADARTQAALRALDGERVVHGLAPAVVVAVEERAARAVGLGGDEVELPWDGLRWRPFIDANRMGALPSAAADIVAPGDLVRVEAQENGWRLAQLPDVQGAIVAMDSMTGGVRALVGGWDFHANQFDHALQAQRQPGSGFKPFVYSAALEHGVTPATVFWDAPLVFEDEGLETVYRPRNDDGRFRGPMRLRQALYLSRNAVSVRVMTRIGPEPILEHLQRFGFDPQALPRTTQLAIGGGIMTFAPIEMVSAYAVLANGGFRVTPHVVTRVARLDGTVLLEAQEPKVCERCAPLPDEALVADGDLPPMLAAERVLDERNAFIMDSMLRDVVRRGTGRRALALDRPDIAGKTGTTDDATDTWFNGYHPNLAASVWVGFADRARTLGAREYGSNTPLPIWIDFMREALAEQPVVERLMPASVARAKVDAASGQLAAAGSADAVFEFFFADNVPAAAPDALARPAAPARVQPEDVF